MSGVTGSHAPAPLAQQRAAGAYRRAGHAPAGAREGNFHPEAHHQRANADALTPGIFSIISLLSLNLMKGKIMRGFRFGVS